MQIFLLGVHIIGIFAQIESVTMIWLYRLYKNIILINCLGHKMSENSEKWKSQFP